jgi:Kef-type K+ transport system membrane component KefB
VEASIVNSVLEIGILLGAAAILGGLFARKGQPRVIGELLAGVIIGPFALGAIPINGTPLVSLSPTVEAFSFMGSIVLLFIAGLEITFSEFKRLGKSSFVIAVPGIFVPFILGYGITAFLGYSFGAGLIIALAMIETSIGTTVRTLEDLDLLDTKEARLMINSAAADDAVGLSLLGVVISLTVDRVPLNFSNITFTSLVTISGWLVLTVGLAFIIPRLIHRTDHWEQEGVIESASTALLFILAAIAGFAGLSPILGAFALGMAIADSRAIKRVRAYSDKVGLIFIPIFFAVTGAQIDVNAFFNFGTYSVVLIFLAVAYLSKILGCGIPASIILRNRKAGLRVGVGMASRGEEGLIVLSIGLAGGILPRDLYGALIVVTVITTILTPLILKMLFAEKAGAQTVAKDQIGIG